MAREEVKVVAPGGRNLVELARLLGHAFNNLELLEEATTHRSYSNENRPPQGDNERLEFLGDAILGAAVSDLLMRAHPMLEEGTLTKYKAALVSEAALADSARRIGLGVHLNVGRGEERNGGRNKASVLANTVEAIVAAVYLDAGFIAARAVVERLVADRFERVGRAERRADYKTKFQEFVQNSRQVVPNYRTVDETGPQHQRTFTVEVLVGDQVFGTGVGHSKKHAEQAAAKLAFRRIQEAHGHRADLDSTEGLPDGITR